MGKSNDKTKSKIVNIPNIERLNQEDIKLIIQDIKKALNYN